MQLNDAVVRQIRIGYSVFANASTNAVYANADAVLIARASVVGAVGRFSGL